MIELTHARLCEALSYCQETGRFTWNIKAGSRGVAGSLAGHSRKDGYVTVKIDKQRFFAHRLAWFFVNGSWPNGLIDHIDGNPANNRISNLRDVSHSKNMHNRKKPQVNNTHGFLGVKRAANGWVACLRRPGMKSYIGRFATPEEAQAAYFAEKTKVMELM